MKILLRTAQPGDMVFLQKMLYAAVFWRESANKPSLEDGLALPEVRKALVDWGERDGDCAVVAMLESHPVGAAWYRLWTDDHFIRGYVDEQTPVLVIGVHKDYRRQGIGGKMIDGLIDQASRQGIERISLMVSKDNHALHLYRKKGFQAHTDAGDSWIMVRTIT